MRERLSRFTAVSALALTVLMCPSTWARQDKERSEGDHKSAATTSETIHGIVAGVTAEGEVYFNHKTNTVVKSEAAFLTIVGSPHHWPEGANTSDNEKHGANEKHVDNHGRRHNVYMVWMTPKTKVCCENGESPDRANANKSENAERSDRGNTSNKSEVTLDKLEVGDHVAVHFTPFEESEADHNVHQNQQMRGKHGRHRTHVGYATEITIMPPRDGEPSKSGSGEKARENSK